MSEAVGLIGLGNMGAPFAARLHAAGYRLHIVDTRREAREAIAALDAVVHPSPAALASAAQIVLLSLPTPEIVERVATGADGLLAGQGLRRVVDLSTSGPEASARLAEAFAGAGIGFVDAPVSGGVAGAKAGTVAIMLAGAPADVAAVSPILAHLGRLFRVGDRPGLGQVTKLLNNLLSAGALTLTGEAMALGRRAGLAPEVMIEVFNAGSGRNSATLDKYPRAILPGTYDLGFTNALMAKDVDLCLGQAEALGLDLPTAEVVRAQWRRAVAELGPDADFSTVVKLADAG